jgi:ribose transport system permease protein
MLTTLVARRTFLLGLVPYLLVPALFLVGAATIEGYSSHSSILSLLVLSSFLGIASLGQTFCVIIGGVDLSIAAVMGFADVVITQLYGQGWSFWTAVLVILGIAAAIGAANALISLALNVNPLVITLGTALIVGGGVLTWNHQATTGTVPTWLTSAVEVINKTGPIPLPGIVVAWIVISVLIILFQRYTRLGREVYATGANATAAKLAYVRTTWVWVAAFMSSAVFAAIAGIFLAGFSGAGDSTVGQPYLFETITAIVVGGTSLLGGRGGYGRTVVGTIVIIQLTTILLGKGASSALQEALLGLLVILLVALYGREPAVAAKL